MARLDGSSLSSVNSAANVGGSGGGGGSVSGLGGVEGLGAALFYDENVIKSAAAAAAVRHTHNQNVFAFDAELNNRGW